MLPRVGVFIATCAYIGYAPFAPGTFGSAAGLLVFYLVRREASPTLEAIAILALLVIGIWSATQAERYFGRSDPSHVVIDEVVGMLVTLAFLPVSALGALVGFVVFRVLDVVKPWPARQFEALPGGAGVLMDDVMAGVYGNLLMWGLIRFLPGWLT